METLSELLSPFDNLEFICEEHGIPCIGLCSNYLCKEKLKFLCMKCIKSGNTCITQEKHELITLSEMLYRFFIKEENKTIDLLEIQTMNLIIREYEKGELYNILTQFNTIKEKGKEKMTQIQKAFSNILEYLINDFKNKNNMKLEEISNLSKKNIPEEEQFNLILNIKMPKEKLTVGVNQLNVIECEVNKQELDEVQIADFKNSKQSLTKLITY